MTEKRFPIQSERNREAGWVPWGVAMAAYQEYARRYGNYQTLERIAERGGFGWSELVGLLRRDEDIKTLPPVL